MLQPAACVSCTIARVDRAVYLALRRCFAGAMPLCGELHSALASHDAARLACGDCVVLGSKLYLMYSLCL